MIWSHPNWAGIFNSIDDFCFLFLRIICPYNIVLLRFHFYSDGRFPYGFWQQTEVTVGFRFVLCMSADASVFKMAVLDSRQKNFVITSKIKPSKIAMSNVDYCLSVTVSVEKNRGYSFGTVTVTAFYNNSLYTAIETDEMFHHDLCYFWRAIVSMSDHGLSLMFCRDSASIFNRLSIFSCFVRSDMAKVGFQPREGTTEAKWRSRLNARPPVCCKQSVGVLYVNLTVFFRFRQLSVRFTVAADQLWPPTNVTREVML